MAIHHGSRALEASLIATVAPLMRRLRTTVSDVADWGGLTFGDYAALDLLARTGALRQGDIARRLGVTAPVVTRLVKGLADAGLLTRTADPDDGRSIVVTLTRRGALRAAAMHADVLAAAADLLRPVPNEMRDHIGTALDDLQVLVPPASRGVAGG